MIPNRIKIKFGGKPYLATAYDADTDEMIPNIKRVDLVAVDVNNSVYEARLVVDVDEIEGEIIAAATVPPTLSDAELDDLARRIERQTASRLEGLRRLKQTRDAREPMTSANPDHLTVNVLLDGKVISQHVGKYMTRELCTQGAGQRKADDE